MNIEPARPEHIEQLSELVLSATQELRGVDFNEEGWARFVASNTPVEFERKLNNSEFSIVCCVEFNELLGFISIKDQEKIDQLFVLPSARKRGIASLLWKSAKITAMENGASGHFWVRSSSVAIPVYEKFGFKLEGDRQVFGGIGFQLMKLKVISE